MNFQILLATITTTAVLWAASAQNGPNCETSCGNVTITYPFGSGEGCYYSPDFLVTCNRSSGVPIPYFGLSTGNVVISNISINQSEIEIMMFVARDCYNTSGRESRSRPSLALRDFRISTKNKFVAIGCDTQALFSVTRDSRANVTDGSGCNSICGRNSLMTNESCSGVGCCEAEVPEGMKSFQILLNSFNNHTNITDFNPCSYGFFVEEGKFSFYTNYLRDFRSVEKMPMVLDWAIGKLTCDEASRNSDNFLCKGNSECDQDYKGPGYRCICREGYEGNPYLPNECKNIDECKRGKHDCEHECEDTEGSYTCSCRKGYSGDGRKDGTGCTKDE
ncbi:wall-associated receptor kinase 2-like [Rutidosis leptorrhynchoides]|uniref:wall-associated receptor kinase 2-like n=1 Tax=Rutidosis leptorrhynchoides TaxID=125765 RepID=UPI003A99391B